MRRSHNADWLMDGELFLGVGLGSDSCAEHEIGVSGLRALFGLDESKDGLSRRTVTVVPPGLELVEFKTAANKQLKRKPMHALGILYREPGSWNRDPVETLKNGETRFYGETKLSAAWDERSFALVAYTAENQARLRILWDAFQRKDIAFWPNIGVFHGGTGLTFAIPSLVPQKHKDSMLDGDLSHRKLLAKAKEIDIEPLLRKSGKSWFALSPRWAKEIGNGQVKTAYEVMYWLNPMEQDKYNSNWVTVEDLQLWAKNEGPILRTRKRA